MKLVLIRTIAKRPVALPALANYLPGLAFALAMGANLLLWHTPLGRTAWALVRAFCHMVPPFVWLGGAAAVALWLIAIKRLW